MTLDEIRAYLAGEFPQVFDDGLAVEDASEGAARLRLAPSQKHLRPGNIVSGPTLMTLADAAAYAALLSLSGTAKMAVTTNLNISFLRAGPANASVVQEARTLRMGRRLATILCEARAGEGPPIAHATLTYALPDRSLDGRAM